MAAQNQYTLYHSSTQPKVEGKRYSIYLLRMSRIRFPLDYRIGISKFPAHFCARMDTNVLHNRQECPKEGETISSMGVKKGWSQPAARRGHFSTPRGGRTRAIPVLTAGSAPEVLVCLTIDDERLIRLKFRRITHLRTSKISQLNPLDYKTIRYWSRICYERPLRKRKTSWDGLFQVN